MWQNDTPLFISKTVHYIAHISVDSGKSSCIYFYLKSFICGLKGQKYFFFFFFNEDLDSAEVYGNDLWKTLYFKGKQACKLQHFSLASLISVVAEGSC